MPMRQKNHNPPPNRLRSILRNAARVLRFLPRRKAYYHRFPAPPILVGGCARSGTTLLLSILGAHPNIHAIPYESASFAYHRKYNPRLTHLLNTAAISQLLSKQEVKPGADRWCEKSPRNIRHIGRILQEFGTHVRFIHIVRDGRDVVTSVHQDQPEEYWVAPQRWVDEVSTGLEFQDHPQVLTVKYEDIIGDFKNSVTHILKFLDLEFHPQLLEFEKNTTVKKHRAWKNGVQPIYTASVRRWEKPEFKERIQQFYNVEAPLGLLEKLGYEKNPG